MSSPASEGGPVADLIRQFLDEQVRLTFEHFQPGDEPPVIDGALTPDGRATVVGIANPAAFAVQLEAFLREKYEEGDRIRREVLEEEWRQRQISPEWQARMRREIEEGAAILRGNTPAPPPEPGRRVTLRQEFPPNTRVHPAAYRSQIGKHIPVHLGEREIVSGSVVNVQVENLQADGTATGLLLTIELPPGVSLPE